MSDPQAPKRLHYGWVMALAFGMMLGGVFWSCVLVSASSRIFEWAGFMTAMAGMALGLPLLAWLGVIWCVYNFKRSWRGRAMLALLPSGIMFAFALYGAVTQPSREQRLRQHFKRVFQAEIPADAYETDVRPPIFDAWNMEFTFRCSKESTLTLIKAMKAERRHVEAPRSNLLVRDWSADRWHDMQAYEHVDQKGNQNILITGALMESVSVTQWYSDKFKAELETTENAQ
jgi:hypothetical protein